MMAEETSLKFLAFLFSLFALHLVAVDGGRELTTNNVPEESHHHHHQHQHHDHMMSDPNLMVFFRLEDLKLGATMEVYFPMKDPSASPHFLPKEEADSIPFSSQQLPYLLQLFSFQPGSTQALAVEEALTSCESSGIKGETKFCATSLESMLDFAQQTLGGIKVLSTTHSIRSGTLVQNYTVIAEPEEVMAARQVACHTLPYPYALFYCHSQLTENKVFMVSLAGEKGDRVEALALCHMDTSEWSSGHPSFRVLGVKPGLSEVCHFFPEDHLVYVPVQNHVSAL
ncbi:BURP domain-containing protein BNM2C [Linum grandiflorum]